jgi:hypothetical protein
MTKSLKILAGAIFAVGLGSAASAAVLTDLYGDKDCFGTGGPCVEDGVTWALSWGDEVASGDPAWTDTRYSSGETASWSQSIAAGRYSSASLTFRTAGSADLAGPDDVVVDGVVVGSMPLEGPGHILAKTWTFAIDTALIADGMAMVSFMTSSGDSWALDYSELTAETAAVPLPASLPLLLGSLGGLAAWRRRANAKKS